MKIMEGDMSNDQLDMLKYMHGMKIGKWKDLDAQKLYEDFKFNLKLKPGKVGDVELKLDYIEPMKPLTVVSMRDAIYMGYSPLKMAFPWRYPMYTYFIDDCLTMSTSPQEIFLLHIGIKEMKGKVLIGGLGIGYVVSKVLEKDNVDKVIVVEKNKNIIKLIGNQYKKIYGDRLEIVNEDLFKYLKNTKEKFDTAHLDIWNGTNEATFYDYVLPLRRLAYKKIKKTYCWAEEQMISQIQNSLMCMMVHCEKENNRKGWNKATSIFLKNCDFNNKEKSIKDFITGIGSSKWEKKWKFE